MYLVSSIEVLSAAGCKGQIPNSISLQLGAEVKLSRKELKKAQTIMQLDELKCRKRVLRRYRSVATAQDSLVSWLLLYTNSSVPSQKVDYYPLKD